jgi:hypothetical protein
MVTTHTAHIVAYHGYWAWRVNSHFHFYWLIWLGDY